MNEVIRRLDADVLLLQERPYTEKGLQNLIGEHYPLENTVGAFGNVILSRYPLSGRVTEKLEPSHGRGCVAATVHLPNGSTLRVVATHLDAFDETGETRRLQAEHLTRFLQLQPSNTILGGDFNAICRGDYSDDHFRWIEVQDGYRGAPTTAVHSLNSIFQAGWQDVFGSSPPCTTVWTLRRVDYLFAHPSAEFDVEQVFVHKRSASDHWPVVADIKLSQGV